MLIAIAAVALQTTVTLQPILSVGCSPEICKAVQTVAKLTESKDFNGAAAALRLLPSKEAKIAWDDAAAPQGSRFDFGQSRDSAISEWSGAIVVTQFTITKANPDIAVNLIPDGGMTLEWSEDPAKPRLTVKIGVKNAGVPVDPAVIHNDVAYAIGTYLGVAKLPLPGLVMSGVDNATQLLPLNGIETSIAKNNVITCQRIAEQVGKSAPVSSALPAMEADPQPVKMDHVLQGTQIPLSFPIKNTGGGTLSFMVVPDCSCFSTRGSTSLAPQKSGAAEVRMNTTDFSGMVQGGLVRHHLYLFSNDPTNPVREIPVEVTITPRFRIIPNREVRIADDNGDLTYEAYLYAPPDHPLTVTSAESQGYPGTVEFEPWSGTMADPDLNEGPLPRKGYKFTLKVKNFPDGMQIGTNIMIATDDPTFPQIADQVIVQKGIIALPPNVFLAEIGKAPRKRSFFVTRRGKPFKILGAEADSERLKVSYEPTQTPGEFLVTVAYDGKAPKGDYHATVTITTDDPKQKTILVPVAGTVR